MPKDPDWNNSQDIARYNFERAKEQQYIDNDNYHGTGRTRGDALAVRGGVAFALAMLWCAAVFWALWPSIEASGMPPVGQKLLHWRYWSGWIFLFASGVWTLVAAMDLRIQHLWSPIQLGKLLFRWALWVFVVAVVAVVLGGLITLIYTA